jgi:hypothetical protein
MINFLLFFSLFNYKHNFKKDLSTSIYEGTLILKENDEFHPPINDVIFKCSYKNNIISLSLSYIDDDKTTTDFKKNQIAHCIRNCFIPFKLEICG